MHQPTEHPPHVCLVPGCERHARDATWVQPVASQRQPTYGMAMALR